MDPFQIRVIHKSHPLLHTLEGSAEPNQPDCTHAGQGCFYVYNYVIAMQHSKSSQNSFYKYV